MSAGNNTNVFTEDVTMQNRLFVGGNTTISGNQIVSGKSFIMNDTNLKKRVFISELNEYASYKKAKNIMPEKKEEKIPSVYWKIGDLFKKFNDSTTNRFEITNYDEGVDMIINGKADALVADMTQCVLAVMRHPTAGLTTLKKPLTIEPIGIAVSKDDPQFYNLVDNYLRAYEKTGVLTKLRKKWFEDNSWVAALP